MDVGVQRLQAQPGGGVTACAEGQAGVQPQRHPLRGIGLLPLRDDQQAFTDLHGLVELLPVVFPVRVGHIVHGQQQRAVLRVGLFQVGHGHTHGGDDGQRGLAALQVERDAADTALFRQQLLVHVVPVLAVVLQEVLKVRLIVDHPSRDTLLLQQLAHWVKTGVGGVDLHFQPFHGVPSVLSVWGQRFVPKKNRPMVFGPVWLPMTGPM